MQIPMIAAATFAAATLCPWAAIAQSIDPAPVPQPAVAVTSQVVSPQAAVVVVVLPGLENVDPSALSRAIAQDLGAPVAPVGTIDPAVVRGTLRIELDAVRRAVVTYRSADGREVMRVTPVPDDPNAAVAVLSLLATNLVRDEASEILDSMAPTPVPPVPQPAPIVPPVARPAPTVSPRRFTIGLEAFAGAPYGRSWTTITAIGGATASFRVSAHFAIGIGQIFFSARDVQGGQRWTISMSPFAEAFTPLSRLFQVYAQAGVALQARTGGAMSASAGVAPYAGVGLRIHAGERVSFGLGARLHFAATNGFQTMLAYVPQGAFALTGGLDVLFHF